jgi:hypothetical protein
MGKDEKAMWDWLYGDMDIWSEYTKKEEKKRENTNRSNSKFSSVNNKLRNFIDRINRKSD